ADAPERARARSVIHGRNILRARALRVLDQIELHPLPLGERLEARSLDRGVMDEDVLAAAIRLDEAESLVVHEPLYGTGLACHAAPRLFVGMELAAGRSGFRARIVRTGQRRAFSPSICVSLHPPPAATVVLLAGFAPRRRNGLRTAPSIPLCPLRHPSTIPPTNEATRRIPP